MPPRLLNDALLRGALLLCLGEFFLAVMAALIKHVSPFVPQTDVVFFRNLFGLLALLPIVLHHGPASLKTARPAIHLFRACVGLTGMYLYFHVIAHMPLAEAILVKLTVPFMLPLITYVWLGERITRMTAVSIALGFLGVVFVLRPGAETFQPVALLGLLAAFFQGEAKVSIRRMSDTEPGHRIVFWFAVFATVISAMPLLWQGHMPDFSPWPWLLAIGVTATLGQLFMTEAYKIANPGRIGPYTYSSVIYAAGLGWMFWGEMLLWTTLAGTALIVAAGLLNLRHGGSAG